MSHPQGSWYFLLLKATYVLSCWREQYFSLLVSLWLLSYVTARQQSRGGSVQCKMWKAAKLSRTCLAFDETGASWRLLKVEEETETNINLSPTLVSIRSMFGSIRPPLLYICFSTLHIECIFVFVSLHFHGFLPPDVQFPAVDMMCCSSETLSPHKQLYCSYCSLLSGSDMSGFALCIFFLSHDFSRIRSSESRWLTVCSNINGTSSLKVLGCLCLGKP